jgi:hypothetical protein
MARQREEAAITRTERSAELARYAEKRAIAQNLTQKLRDLGIDEDNIMEVLIGDFGELGFSTEDEVTTDETMGVNEATVPVTDFFSKRIGDIMPATVTPVAKKPRRKDPRNGATRLAGVDLLAVEGRDNFDKLPLGEQIAFLVRVADLQTGKYNNADRQWLSRINPIARCYRTCCNNDTAIFQSKFKTCVKKTGKFVVGTATDIAKACVECLEQNVTVADSAGRSDHDMEE